MKYAVVALALALLSLAACTSSTHVAPGTPDTLLALLNAQRAAAGAPPLEMHAECLGVAQAQADYNAQTQTDATSDAAGLTLVQRLAATGMDFDEEIVSTSAGHGSDAEVALAFTDTLAERNLLLSEYMTAVGIGVADDGGVQRWVAIACHGHDDHGHED